MDSTYLKRDSTQRSPSGGRLKNEACDLVQKHLEKKPGKSKVRSLLLGWRLRRHTKPEGGCIKTTRESHGS